MTSKNISPMKSSAAVAWFICILGAIFYCYEYFLRISPSVMEDSLRAAYHINATAFGNLVGTYYYAYTPMQLIVGVLMDRYGPRRLLTIASLLCAVGAYLFASSHSLLIAEIGRFMVGFGSAFAFVGVLKLATIWLPPDRFAMIAGLTTALGMLGAMFGDITLTAIVKAQGWRNTVIATAAIGVVLAGIIYLIVRDQRDNDIQASASHITFAQLFAGIIALARQPAMWIVGIIGGILYLSASAFAETWGIPYLRDAQHYSPQLASSAESIVFLGWIIGGPVMGAISDRLHKRWAPLMWGGLLTAVCFFLLLYVHFNSVMVVSLLLFAIGFFSSAEIIVFAMACDMTVPKLAGTAVAFINMLVMIGGAIFQPLIGKLLDIHWSGAVADSGVRLYSTTDFQFALISLPICYLLVFFLGLLFSRDP
jgi:sugar phosphate permease